MKKCRICGMMRKIVMSCSKCGRDNICLNDMNTEKRLCADCEVAEDKETLKYIEQYQKYQGITT